MSMKACEMNTVADGGEKIALHPVAGVRSGCELPIMGPGK